MNQTVPSSVPHDQADRATSLVLGCKSLITELTYPQWLLFAILAISVSSFLKNRPRVKAPYVGYRSWFEPTFLVQMRYFANAKSLITEGFKKVLQLNKHRAQTNQILVQRWHFRRQAKRYRYRGLVEQIYRRIKISSS